MRLRDDLNALGPGYRAFAATPWRPRRRSPTHRQAAASELASESDRRTAPHGPASRGADPAGFVPVRGGAGITRRWARLVSNQRPLACEASALPLSYAPWGREELRGRPGARGTSGRERAGEDVGRGALRRPGSGPARGAQPRAGDDGDGATASSIRGGRKELPRRSWARSASCRSSRRRCSSTTGPTSTSARTAS